MGRSRAVNGAARRSNDGSSWQRGYARAFLEGQDGMSPFYGLSERGAPSVRSTAGTAAAHDCLQERRHGVRGGGATTESSDNWRSSQPREEEISSLVRVVRAGGRRRGRRGVGCRHVRGGQRRRGVSRASAVEAREVRTLAAGGTTEGSRAPGPLEEEGCGATPRGVGRCFGRHGEDVPGRAREGDARDAFGSPYSIRHRGHGREVERCRRRSSPNTIGASRVSHGDHAQASLHQPVDDHSAIPGTLWRN